LLSATTLVFAGEIDRTQSLHAMNSASYSQAFAASRPAVSSKVRSGHTLGLKAGEWVEVRSAEEILGTLDPSQALDGLPFMPEMLRYCGRRFRVFKSAHKTCDTIDRYVIRRMSATVHLDGLRCDGEAHGGCQASCLLFWKEAWLKRVDGPHANEPDSTSTVEGVSGEQAAAALRASTRAEPLPDDPRERFRCQATDLLKASGEVRRRDRWSPAFYWRDLTSRNVSVVEFVRYGILAIANNLSLRLGWRRYPHLCGQAGGKTPTQKLDLAVGERVRVRSKQEIVQTLNPELRNRGLMFDYEMVPYCGDGEYRVLRRVERIINEKTGHMMTLPGACLILDGVTCGGKLSKDRMFCPRAVYPYWREIWLERASAEPRSQ
jgi:hypothetical protein